MTTLREAAQQALEALQWHYRQGHSNTLGGFRLKIDEKALRELSAALAQQDEPVEPVAWMFELARNFNLVGYGGWEKRITEYRPNTPEGSVRNVTPLYTAPPQRQPLTEEEKRTLADKFLSCQPESYEVSGVFDLISAVERAHQIKE